MIRAVQFACDLPRRQADALNRESGRIYTATMVEHYRIYRKHGVWLKQNKAEKVYDAYHVGEERLLHAHSIDASIQAFYSACKTAKTNKANGLAGAKHPHKRKVYRTTVWKHSGLRLKDKRSPAERRAQKAAKGEARPLRFSEVDSVLVLSLAEGLAPLEVRLPSHLAGLREAMFVEMRLVFNKASKHYEWHLVIDDQQTVEPLAGLQVVAGDLGEVHPIALSDGEAAEVITCRELRAARQFTNKTLAEIRRAQSRCTKHSRRWWRLEKRKRRFLEQQERRIRDIEHKISRAAVDFAKERGAVTIALGDVRDIAGCKRLSTKAQQKISNWSHGQLRQYITYKAAAVGITVQLVNEANTTKTCPNPDQPRHQHKPHGRRYVCPECGLVAHRDVVGAVNILSRFTTGEVGKVRPPAKVKYRHPFIRHSFHHAGKRSPQDTGHIAGISCIQRTGDCPPQRSQNRRNSHEEKRAAQEAARL